MHRRQARDAFPNPLAIASAAADAFASAFPNPFADPEPDPDPQTTLVSVVYVTAAKTFEGPVGGYTTLGVPGTTEEATPTTHFQVRPTATDSSPIVVDTAAPTRSKSSTASTTSRTSLSNGLPASIVPTTSVASSLAIFVATSSPSKPTISPTASSAESTSSVSKSGGMGAGGKAALAIGILLLFGTALAITLFFLKKRKNAMRAERLDDEKTDTFAGAGRAASTRTAVTAPRLSLRPVTQFLPNLGGDKYATRGNVLAMSSTPISRPTDPRKNGSAWDRPMLSQDSNTNNPFGSHAETIDSTNAKGPAVTGSTGPGGQTVPRATAAAATAGAYGLARGASKRENQAKQIDFTNNGPYRSPPSPVGTDFSQASDTYGSPNQTRQGAAISAAGGLANSAVHRVQLDFKPSMEDELELRAGQLIRLLHEYDDGWVSQFPHCYASLLTYPRLSVFALIVLNKVSFHGHVSLHVPSSPVPSKTVPEAPHQQVYAVLSRVVQCHLR